MGVAYVFDTELTGRDDGQIIEAAWIRMPAANDLAGPSDRIDLHDLAPYQSFEERYRPDKPITFGAMAVHHILPQELEKCPPHTEFALPVDMVYMVGHSIDFDWAAAGAPPHVKRICTHAIAQHLFDHCDGKSLSALLYFTMGPSDYTRTLTKQAHGAMADCWNTVHLLRKIVALRPELQTWSQLWAYSEACREPLRMPMGRNRGALLTTCDNGELNWYLEQGWTDSYFRKAIRKVLSARATATGSNSLDDELDDDDDDDDWMIDPEMEAKG